MIVYDISDCMVKSIISPILIMLLSNISWVISTGMSRYLDSADDQDPATVSN
jgi:hypothetical protein